MNVGFWLTLFLNIQVCLKAMDNNLLPGNRFRCNCIFVPVVAVYGQSVHCSTHPDPHQQGNITGSKEESLNDDEPLDLCGSRRWGGGASAGCHFISWLKGCTCVTSRLSFTSKTHFNYPSLFPRVGQLSHELQRHPIKHPSWHRKGGVGIWVREKAVAGLQKGFTCWEIRPEDF